MPKLLLITTNFENGAIPNILLDLAPHWVRLGWSLHFLALEPLPEDQASVIRCRSLGYPLESLGVSARAAWRALRALGPAIRRIAPDVIHTHLGRADVYTPWVKGTVPMVSTFHSVRRNSGRLTQWGWKVSDRMVAHRTGVSQACLDSVYADGYLTSPHSVIYNPVDASRLVPRRHREAVLASFGWDPSVRLLLAVGRLVPVKGHTALVAAFAQLAPGQPDLRLVIAGDGPLKDELETLIDQFGLSGRVVLAGAWEGVGDLYAAAELLVFPSQWEGLGLVPLEALACGCPVASSRLPAVAEFLTEGVTGRFFEPGSSGEIARVVGEMLADPVGIRRLADQGRTLVLDRFSPEPIARQYDAVYRRALGA